LALSIFDGLEGGTVEIQAELLETGMGGRGVEVNALVERVDFDGGLGGGEGTLGTLTCGMETANSTGVSGEI
jgi:hypothetical protein